MELLLLLQALPHYNHRWRDCCQVRSDSREHDGFRNPLFFFLTWVPENLLGSQLEIFIEAIIENSIYILMSV